MRPPGSTQQNLTSGKDRVGGRQPSLPPASSPGANPGVQEQGLLVAGPPDSGTPPPLPLGLSFCFGFRCSEDAMEYSKEFVTAVVLGKDLVPR